jgi:AcrR family transcriptional regulator
MNATLGVDGSTGMDGDRGAAIQEPAKRPRGRPRKTAEEQDDGNRRRALLQWAAKLFRRKGFNATSTRDIAAAVGMRSGSPFYHFESKGALLFAVMEEGMRSAIDRQDAALARAREQGSAAAQLRILVRSHVDVLLGPGSDFIPVMLYESRSITPAQRRQLAALQRRYEAPWMPLLDALRSQGRLRCDVKLARLLMFGALNWSVQWFDRRKGASIDELADAAMALFIGETA